MLSEKDTTNIKKDTDLSFTYKAEKLLSAVYLITEHIKDNDLIKDKVRISASQALTEMFQAGYQYDQALKRHSWRMSLLRLAETAAFLRVAETAGLISTMNTDLVLEELSKLSQQIQSVVVVKGFNLSTQTEPIVPAPVSVASLFSDKPVSVERSKSAEIAVQIPKKDTPSVVKDISISSVDKGNEIITRQQKITDILAEHGKLSIKHIARYIPGCSEKTVQRDLNKMIDLAQVVREGEKRWSVYMLP